MFYMNLVDYPCCPPGMTWGLLYLNHVAYSDPLKDVGWGGAPPWFKRKPGFQNPVSLFGLDSYGCGTCEYVNIRKEFDT